MRTGSETADAGSIPAASTIFPSRFRHLKRASPPGFTAHSHPATRLPVQTHEGAEAVAALARHLRSQADWQDRAAAAQGLECSLVRLGPHYDYLASLTINSTIL